MPSSESQIKTAADSVLNRFGRDVITDRYEFRGDTTLTVARNSVAEVVRWLRGFRRVRHAGEPLLRGQHGREPPL